MSQKTKIFVHFLIKAALCNIGPLGNVLSLFGQIFWSHFGGGAIFGEKKFQGAKFFGDKNLGGKGQIFKTFFGGQIKLFLLVKMGGGN